MTTKILSKFDFYFKSREWKNSCMQTRAITFSLNSVRETDETRRDKGVNAPSLKNNFQKKLLNVYLNLLFHQNTCITKCLLLYINKSFTLKFPSQDYNLFYL